MAKKKDTSPPMRKMLQRLDLNIEQSVEMMHKEMEGGYADDMLAYCLRGDTLIQTMSDNVRIPTAVTKIQVPPQTSQDRRSSDERRVPNRDKVETERRTRVDRRQQPDRRGNFYSIKYISPEAVEELRQWLEANCEGGWTIGIPDMETAATWENFRVRFERQSDLSKLAKMLSVYWPSWMS